jgi:membrane-associated protein
MISLSAENLARAGIFTIGAIVFAESGLFIGFFLPGDSLLFTAGFLASQGILPIHELVLVCVICAIAGDSVGYAFGKRVGPRLLKKPDGKVFKKKYLEQSEAFYEKHGKKTIILARFTPIVRTFAPIVAGIGNMNYRTFLTFNVIGGTIWALALTYGGYYIGRAIPGVQHYLEPAILLVVALSLSPGLIHFLKEPKNRKRAKALPRQTAKKIRSLFTNSKR